MHCQPRAAAAGARLHGGFLRLGSLHFGCRGIVVRQQERHVRIVLRIGHKRRIVLHSMCVIRLSCHIPFRIVRRHLEEAVIEQTLAG